jgi:hypothetical protein
MGGLPGKNWLVAMSAGRSPMLLYKDATSSLQKYDDLVSGALLSELLNNLMGLNLGFSTKKTKGKTYKDGFQKKTDKTIINGGTNGAAKCH